MPVSPIDRAGADAGGKAQGLAALAAAGVPVPPGFVIAADAAVDADVVAAAAALGGALVVRSSAATEDVRGALAPGIYLSVRAATAADVPEAIAAVRASADGAPALAYRRARGITAPTRMAVIVQREIPGPHGTIYTRDPAGGDGLLVEIFDEGAAGPSSSKARRASPGDGGVEALVVPREGATPGPAWVATLRAHALAAERVVGGPADVEWVAGDDGVWIVQARPLAPGPRAGLAALPAEALAFSAAEPDATWHWDAAHNPAPLSGAQAGLVELVEARGLGTARQRVVEGYLYYARERGRAPTRVITPDALHAAWHAELRPRLRELTAAIDAAPTLEAALDGYLAFYALYAGVVTPAVSAARKGLVRALEPLGEDALLAVAALIGDARRRVDPTLGREAAPDLAAAWDVAALTAAEAGLPLGVAPASPADPAADAASIGRTAARLAPAARAAFEAAVGPARQAATVAEEDDLLFARAQAGVRRALAALARTWGVALEELTAIALADVVAAARVGAAPADLGARATAARETTARRARLRPPLTIRGGVARYQASSTAAPVLRGRGTGGRAIGPVVRLDVDTPRPSAGAVLVAPAILPTMAPRVLEAAALVSVHDGLLGHGPALAREHGLPCLVGCPGALELAEGTRVLIDGDAGLLVVL